MPVSHG